MSNVQGSQRGQVTPGGGVGTTAATFAGREVYSPAYEGDINRAKVLLGELKDTRGLFQRFLDTIGLTSTKELEERQKANKNKYAELDRLFGKLDSAEIGRASCRERV